MSVDLKELARRESEQVEWKEGVADPEDVVRTLVAFANDLSNLGGGYVVCGAREVKDEHGFQRLEAVGLAAAQLREVEGRVLAGCRDRVSPPIVPLTEELPTADPSRRILVFTIAATRRAHTWRGSEQGSRHYVRIGRETREARNGVLLELLTRKGEIEDWDRRHPPGALTSELDLLALRDTLVRMGRAQVESPVEEYISADLTISVFVPALCAMDPLTRVLRPRNFALLLFGRVPQRRCLGAHAIFSVYPGIDRSSPVSIRHEIAGTVLQQAARLIALVEPEAHLVIDKEDRSNPHHPRYPIRALEEVIVNALVHRSYELPHPVRVTVFSDRVEIYSPGGLERANSLRLLEEGRPVPVWRNQALAWFFNQLGLAQAEGQGIATARRLMQALGSPPPEFEVTPDSVLCTLRANPKALAAVGRG